MAFDQSTRTRLQKFVSESRAILTEEFTRQLQSTYGMDPKTGDIADQKTLTFLDNQGRQTALLLRETLAHYLVTIQGKSQKQKTCQALDRIIREQAFTVLNRLGALRMAEARGFLIESISKGYSSKGFQLYKGLAGTALGKTEQTVTGDTYRQYLFSLFDEFSLDLAILFDRYSIQGRLFPRESALLALLDQINHFEIEHLWAEDETIGWIYQYFNSQEERKKMRAESQAPRNSRELAVRNQFFTPRYVVEFLTDNTLGRIWYEMTQGKTSLMDTCRYLVRRPSEIFLAKGEDAPDTDAEDSESLSQEELLRQPAYIAFRELKDPRELRMIDPACGSMHFGLYAFDLFEKIYEEAWQWESELGPEAFDRSEEMAPLQTTYPSFDEFKKAVPKLIIEHNIHGVDIDPRAVQIAGLSLWQRAHRAWHQMGIKAGHRPIIKKSNIVCAEPMPGNKEILKEFTSKLNPPLLGQLVESIFDKMELAGEAGTLLKIEEEIASTISKAKDEFNKEILKSKEEKGFLPGMAPKRQPTLFDFAELPDDTNFWDTAEKRILNALENYADKADSDNGQKRLFAEDAAKGFAFVDLCRKKFDVVLMNPPFGDGSTSISEYLSNQYGDISSNIIVQFIQRGQLFTKDNDGFIGVVLDRTVLIKNSYEKFRKLSLINNKSLLHVVDLGWNVLDANVEVNCITISSKIVSTAFGINVTQATDKEFNLQHNEGASIWMPLEKIEKFPNTAINLSMPDFFINAVVQYPSLEEISVKFINGHTIKSDVFKRLIWEVPKESLKKKLAVPMWNGSSYNPFRTSFQEAVLIKEYAGGLSNHKSTIYRSADKHFLPGLCYGKRGDFLDVQELPPNFMLTNEGFAAPIKDPFLFSISSYLNSSIAQFFINLYCGQHKGVGYVNLLPMPKISEKNKEELLKNYNQLIFCAKSIQCLCEYDHEFTSPFPKLDGDRMTPSSVYEFVKDRQSEFYRLIDKNDKIFYIIFNLNTKQIDTIQSEIVEKRSKVNLYYSLDIKEEARAKESISLAILSYLMQIIFNDYETLVEFRMGIFDPGQVTNKWFIEMCYRIDFPWSKRACEEIVEEMTNCFQGDLIDQLVDPKYLFEFHLKARSKGNRQAPIYWPLQTPSGSYTLWVYYHRLTEQTLYTCVNDFLEGPKGKITEVSDVLMSLRNKNSRSNSEEKELARLTDLESELKDFRDELLRIAKFWKPNLNDGVQITAAPLWKLFQHKQWQKKLKQTWEKLENGDYDWAHLACSIWPERVLRKCHTDRSLAIAHDVEDEFWEEVEVPVIRRGKDTGKTKWEWHPRKLSETQLRDLIQQFIETGQASR